MNSSVEAESIQVGSGFLALEDMSRGFYDLAALLARVHKYEKFADFFWHSGSYSLA